MKKLILSALIAACSISLLAQTAEFDRLYHTYKGEEGVVALKIPGFLMRMFSAIPDLEDSEKQLLRSLRSLTVLTIDEPDLYPEVNFTKEIDLTHLKDGYQKLLEVHDGEEDVIIAAREKNGKVSDLYVVVGGDENVLVHVCGRMETDLLESLAKVSGVKSLNYTAQISP